MTPGANCWFFSGQLDDFGKGGFHVWAENGKGCGRPAGEEDGLLGMGASGWGRSPPSTSDGQGRRSNRFGLAKISAYRVGISLEDEGSLSDSGTQFLTVPCVRKIPVLRGVIVDYSL